MMIGAFRERKVRENANALINISENEEISVMDDLFGIHIIKRELATEVVLP